MSNLKSLTFTELPNKSVDSTVRRREKLIEKLNEQLEHIRNPNFKVTFNRWETNNAGERVVVEEKRNPSNPGGSPTLGETCSLQLFVSVTRRSSSRSVKPRSEWVQKTNSNPF